VAKCFFNEKVLKIWWVHDIYLCNQLDARHLNNTTWIEVIKRWQQEFFFWKSYESSGM